MRDNDIWRIWDRETAYGETLFRRATGELPEMESAKAAAALVKTVFRPGDTILDVGCGAGHYLRSLRRVLDAPFGYVGLDATAGYVALARQAWDGVRDVSFEVGDAFALPFADAAFDIVMCNNLLLHLPSIARPLSELVRVARRRLQVRSLFGERSFQVKEVYSPRTHPGFPDFPPGLDEFDEDGAPRAFYYLNTYSRAYVAGLLAGQPRVTAHALADDLDFDQASIDGDARRRGAPVNATTMLGGRQTNGALVMQWAMLTVDLLPPTQGEGHGA